MLDTTADTRAVATANGFQETDVVVKAGKLVRLQFSWQMGMLRGRHNCGVMTQLCGTVAAGATLDCPRTRCMGCE